MKKGYVFLSNSTKPTREKALDRKPVKLTNVSRPCLQAAIDMGYEVYFGENRQDPQDLYVELPVNLYDSHTYRSITAFKDNRQAIKNLSAILENNEIDVIHCNTPVGGMVGRWCGRKYHIKHIIYTAHGFHFFKGAPLINNTLFKWAEMIMAHWTDVIITMNQEDYEAAQKFRLKRGGKVYKVHGVGISLSEYSDINVDISKKRSELGLSDNDFVCVSAGDIVARKNYKSAIEAIAKTNNPHIHYLICGEGPEKDTLVKLSDSLGISDQIHFLGFRNDIKELFKISNCFLFTTLQEGLPRSLMEAMAIGLPVIASKIRGNVDLVIDGEGGFLFEPNDSDGYSNALNKLVENPILRSKMSQINKEKIKEYDVKVVEQEIRKIYAEVLK